MYLFLSSLKNIKSKHVKYVYSCISKHMTYSYLIIYLRAGKNAAVAKNEVKVLITQSCPTLCNPMDDSLPGSSVQGILQAGEWNSGTRPRWQCYAVA